MSRETLSSLLLKSQNYCMDASTSSSTALSDTKTFLIAEINNACSLIYSKLANYKVQREQTASTVASQQYYHLPPDFGRLEGITVTVAGVNYPLKSIESEDSWENLNQVDFSGNIFPQYVYVRRDDFGIWPKPTTAGYTITLSYNYILRKLANEDYSTGTVVVTNNSTTVTGTSTAFTAAMVGRWFKFDNDGDWYRITSRTSDTVITLESVFEGSTATTNTYVIGESPELPVELHEYIPWIAAATWHAGPRRDPEYAQTLLNYAWTGDFSNKSRELKNAAGGILNFIRMYKARGRNNSQLIQRNQQIGSRFDERWSSTIS
jgi:hypothetical protein